MRRKRKMRMRTETKRVSILLTTPRHPPLRTQLEADERDQQSY